MPPRINRQNAQIYPNRSGRTTERQHRKAVTSQTAGHIQVNLGSLERADASKLILAGQAFKLQQALSVRPGKSSLFKKYTEMEIGKQLEISIREDLQQPTDDDAMAEQ